MFQMPTLSSRRSPCFHRIYNIKTEKRIQYLSFFMTQVSKTLANQRKIKLPTVPLIKIQQWQVEKLLDFFTAGNASQLIWFTASE